MTAVLSAACSLPPPSVPPRPDPFAALDAVAARAVAEGGLPGAVVAAGDTASVRFLKAYGRLQLAPAPVPMPPDALFDLASVTKVVGTTTAVLLLVEDGTLSLDDPLASRLSAWADRAGDGITIRHLLTHTSGLPAYLAVEPIRKKYGPGPCPGAVLRSIAELPLRQPAGTGVEYSCLNMILAAAVVKETTDSPLHELLTRRVFGPLGMKDTGWRLESDQLLRLAPTAPEGRLDAEGRMREPPSTGPFCEGLVHDPLARYYTTVETCCGNAGLYSTAEDLGRFARMILGRGALDGVRVLRPETVDAATRVQTPAGTETRGLGWDVWDDPPFRPREDAPGRRPAIGHFGFTGTMIWIDPEAGAWAVVLASRLHGGAGAKADGLRREVVRATARAAHQAASGGVP
jgi:CubicO group peptidase (beta-lactamase class C family)